MKFYGAIYCHECLITGLRYFGSVFFGSENNHEEQVKKILTRWNAGYGYVHCSSKFAAAIKEYGFANFNHRYKIFTFTADEEYEAEEKLRNLERAFITAYDTKNHGYNTNCGPVYLDVFDIWDVAEPDYPFIDNEWIGIGSEALIPKKVRLPYGWNNPWNWNMYGKYGEAVSPF